MLTTNFVSLAICYPMSRSMNRLSNCSPLVIKLPIAWCIRLLKTSIFELHVVINMSILFRWLQKAVYVNMVSILVCVMISLNMRFAHRTGGMLTVIVSSRCVTFSHTVPEMEARITLTIILFFWDARVFEVIQVRACVLI